VRVNLGGEPDRDDSGLPPVDIEIPDDARELDRDVQAYRRELRAHRRRMRIGRLHAPLTRDGLVLPLLAGFLAMVLISGVLLTVFTAGQGSAPSTQATNASIGPAPGTGHGTAASQPAQKPAQKPAPRLASAAVIVNGQRQLLSSLAPMVLALVPAGCQCGNALRRLRRASAAAGVQLYLVGIGGDLPLVRRLAKGGGQPAAKIAHDPDQVLAAAYHPRGLTALLVHADGSIGPVLRHVRPASRLAGQIRALSRAAP
jgi:hypothetical protein